MFLHVQQWWDIGRSMLPFHAREALAEGLWISQSDFAMATRYGSQQEEQGLYIVIYLLGISTKDA